MARTPRDRLQHEVDVVDDLVEDGEISAETADALKEWVTALDEAKTRYKYRDADGQVKTYKPRTVEGYLSCLRLSIQAGLDLLDCSAEEFNDLMDTMHDDDGKAKSTLIRYQAAAQTFFRYHDVGVDPDDVHMYKPDRKPKHDEYDMFTEEDIAALRRACGTTNLATRNRAFLELLIFTGQRITALLTLRIKDVDVQEGYIYLNDEYAEAYGGMKGALARGRKRPMFGARKYVRDWIQYHPEGDDPDAWLFIGNPSHPRTDPDDHWADSSAYQTLSRIAETAEVEKPVDPHNFRHYAATVLKRDYDLDGDTIRMLLGHVEGSSALEDTYSHLFDDDYIQKAEEALGYKESEDDGGFTPDACPTCGELLESHWRRCPSCDEVFGPTDDFEERVGDVVGKLRDGAVDSQDPEEISAYKMIIDAVEDPAALAEELAGVDSR